MSVLDSVNVTRRGALALLGAGAAMPALMTAPVLAQAPTPSLDVPYVPTPQDVVDRMLEIVKPTANDFVMDLGCGDGRMLVTAASKFGSKGYGVDLNPVRIQEATENAKKANVTDKIRFEVKNLFDTSISDASVLTMYLLPSVNLQLRPRILDEMKPDSRIVSHVFHMADWEPDLQDEVRGRNIYHWIVPAKIAGKWSLRDGSDTITLNVFQQFQKLTGTAEKESAGGKGNATGKVSGSVKGNEVTFIVDTGSGPKTYTGQLANNMVGGGPGTSWNVSRETRMGR